MINNLALYGVIGAAAQQQIAYEDYMDPEGAAARREKREAARLLADQRAHELAVARASAPVIHVHHDHTTVSSGSGIAPFLFGVAEGMLLDKVFDL